MRIGMGGLVSPDLMRHTSPDFSITVPVATVDLREPKVVVCEDCLLK